MSRQTHRRLVRAAVLDRPAPTVTGQSAVVQRRGIVLDDMILTRTRRGRRRLRGRAVRYNAEDRVSDNGIDFYVETWQPGAFAGALDTVPVLAMHERRQLPVGAVDQWHDDEHELTFDATLADTTSAREVAELVDLGAVRGLSIGATAKLTRRDGNRVIRVLAVLDEVSLVTWAALKDSRVLALD